MEFIEKSVLELLISKKSIQNCLIIKFVDDIDFQY